MASNSNLRYFVPRKHLTYSNDVTRTIMPLDNQIDLKSGRDLKPLLLEGEAREQEIRKAQSLHRIPLTSRESSDLIVRAKK